MFLSLEGLLSTGIIEQNDNRMKTSVLHICKFCIGSIFAKVDRDGDQTISISEVKALITDIFSEKVGVEKEYAIAEVLKTFDVNKDGTITEDEFVKGCTKWIHEAKQLAEDGSSHSRRSLRQASSCCYILHQNRTTVKHKLP